MSLSCIIPVLNGEVTLAHAVASLIETGVPGLEIVIVDDGSRDGTARLSRELVTRHSGTVRFLEHSGARTRGAAAARNRGVRACRGEVICFLDADDVVLPNRFDSALPILTQRRDVAAVYQLARVVCIDRAQLTNWSEGDLFGPRDTCAGGDLLAHLLRSRTSIATSAIVIRKAAFEQVGGFDTRLKTAEDCQLWWKLAAVENVVPGDLHAPVSEYHRRDGSLFSRGVHGRREYLRALSYFAAWLRAKGVHDDRLTLTETAVRTYLEASLVEARSRGLRIEVARLLIQSLSACGAAWRRQNLGHLVYGVLGGC